MSWTQHVLYLQYTLFTVCHDNNPTRQCESSITSSASCSDPYLQDECKKSCKLCPGKGFIPINLTIDVRATKKNSLIYLWLGSTPLYVTCGRLAQYGSVDTIHRFFVASTASHKYAKVVSFHCSRRSLK